MISYHILRTYPQTTPPVDDLRNSRNGDTASAAGDPTGDQHWRPLLATYGRPLLVTTTGDLRATTTGDHYWRPLLATTTGDQHWRPLLPTQNVGKKGKWKKLLEPGFFNTPYIGPLI